MKAIVVTWLLGLPVLSLAGDEERDESGRVIQYQQRQELQEDDFVGVSIDGELVRPGLGFVAGRPAGTFNPLIRFRTDFVVEVRATIDEVK